MLQYDPTHVLHFFFSYLCFSSIILLVTYMVMINRLRLQLLLPNIRRSYFVLDLWMRILLSICLFFHFTHTRCDSRLSCLCFYFFQYLSAGWWAYSLVDTLPAIWFVNWPQIGSSMIITVFEVDLILSFNFVDYLEHSIWFLSL